MSDNPMSDNFEDYFHHNKEDRRLMATGAALEIAKAYAGSAGATANGVLSLYNRLSESVDLIQNVVEEHGDPNGPNQD